MAPHNTRQKLSTTIAPESYDYLQQQIETGRANTLADAIDRLVATVRRLENHLQLEAATSAYFQGLSREEMADERKLESALMESASDIDFKD